MGFIGKALNSLFGGGGSNTVVQEAPTPAQSAAPAQEAATQATPETSPTKKRKRGKAALMVNNNATPGTGSTGLNI